MSYSSLMLTYYVMVQDFIAQYAAYVTIDLIFSIAAFILLVMAIYFFVALCISFEARSDRALSKLNRFFYRYPVIKNNSLSILNNIIRHSPKEFGYKWNDYLKHQDNAPSMYLNTDGCINLAARFNKASYFTKIMISFAIFAALIMLMIGLAIADPALTFSKTLYSLLLAPILIGVLAGILAAIISIKGTETYKNMLSDFTMFQRNIDRAANGMKNIDQNIVSQMITANQENKRTRKFYSRGESEDYSEEETSEPKYTNHNKPEKSKSAGVDEDFLTRLRNTSTKNKDEGAPPANFNLGGEVKPLAASTNLTVNNNIKPTTTPTAKLAEIFVPEPDVVKDESDVLIKQYAEEKQRILAEIAKIKEETANYKTQNQQINKSINAVEAQNPQQEFKNMLSAKQIPNEAPELEKVSEKPQEIVTETDYTLQEPTQDVTYTAQEDVLQPTESDLTAPKKRGRKPKAKTDDIIDLSSTLDQLASAMESLKKK